MALMHIEQPKNSRREGILTSRIYPVIQIEVRGLQKKTYLKVTLKLNKDLRLKEWRKEKGRPTLNSFVSHENLEMRRPRASQKNSLESSPTPTVKGA